MQIPTPIARSRRLVVPAWLLAAGLTGLVGAAVFAQPAPAPAPAPSRGAGAANVPTTVEKTKTADMSLLELFMKGGIFMIPIGLCSLLGLAIVIERAMSLRKGRITPPSFMAGLKAAFGRNRDRATALEFCRSNDSPLARVMAAGLAKLPRGEEAVEQSIEDVGANEVVKLRRNFRMLFGISAVAPLLGLLGTVSGMIKAFQITAAMGLGRADELAKGIYEALVTTYAGLLVAIPVMVAYYYFQGKIERIVSEINDLSIEFVEHYAGDGEASASPATLAPASAQTE